MRHYLFAILMCVSAACAADVGTDDAPEARSIDVISPVEADQFVAPEDVGVSTEALFKDYTFINSENGAQINRGGSWDGLRCWLMRRCDGPLSVCSNSDYTCTFNTPSPGNTKCVGKTSALGTYTTLCGPPGCNIFQQGGGGIVIGTFNYGTDPTYVFKTGSAPGFPYANCKLTPGARLRLSTAPL